MTRLALCLALFPAAASALTPSIPGPEPGAWTCLDAIGGPAFAFSILDDTHYADPSGAIAGITVYDWGVFGFDGGIWAGHGGRFVPGIMALVLPDDPLPVICTHS